MIPAPLGAQALRVLAVRSHVHGHALVASARDLLPSTLRLVVELSEGGVRTILRTFWRCELCGRVVAGGSVDS